MTENPVNYGSNNPLINLEKLNRLREKLGAQEKELSRLLARLEDLEARREKLTEEIDSTSKRSEHGKNLLASSSGLCEEDWVTCNVCGKTYLKGEIHECPEVTD